MSDEIKPTLITQISLLSNEHGWEQADPQDIMALARSLRILLTGLHGAVLDSNSGADDAAALYAFLGTIGLPVP